MRRIRVLYAGDGRPGGACDYLRAVLGALPADVVHRPSDRPLPAPLAARPFDVYILSDIRARFVGAAARRAIARRVEAGAGLLMVGGWGSFAAGGWGGTEIERLLPVRCAGRDDRENLPGGARLEPGLAHVVRRGLSFAEPPVVCGLNRFRPRPGALVVLRARSLAPRGRPFPLLVVDAAHRTAALATDVAPHWCGGLVDWGGGPVVVPAGTTRRVEVGRLYVRLLHGLVRWLAGRPRSVGAKRTGGGLSASPRL